MKITLNGARIKCSRVERRIGSGGDYHRPIVDFDSGPGVVPPHVREQLTVSETRELLQFLSEQKRGDAESSSGQLDALPELLFEATEILYTAEQLDGQKYREIAKALASLNAALEIVRENQLSRK